MFYCVACTPREGNLKGYEEQRLNIYNSADKTERGIVGSEQGQR